MSAKPAVLHRVFTALWPDEATRSQLTEIQRAFAFPAAAKIVKPERLHITLNFLDALPAEKIKPLLALNIPFKPFTLQLTRAALLNREVAVLEPPSPPAALVDLHARLSIALAELDLPLDLRAFRPHITLARAAQGSKVPKEIRPVCWHIESWSVVESVAGANPGYRLLAR